MSYQEKNTVVTLTNMLLLFGVYVINLLRMAQQGDLVPITVFSLWFTLVVVGIITTIAGTIITQIALNIVQVVRTNEEDSFFTDERDNIIDLKGIRSAYYVISLGVLASIIALMLGGSPIVVFIVLTMGAFISSISGEFARLYHYRRGF